MTSVTIVKKIVEGFLSDDYQSVLTLLNEEADKHKKANRKNAYRELISIIKVIPSSRKKTFTAASTSTQTVAKGSYFQLDSQRSLVNEHRPVVTPEDVVLNSESKALISNFFKEWEFADRLSERSLAPSNKLLLYGAPGTGKTHLAHAIANQLDLPLTIVNLDELVSSYLGSTGKNLRDIFQIPHNKKTILFLDEFDTVAKFRSDEKELGELKRIVTVLLQKIDQFPESSILIAATNHEDILDRAVWRRFPLKIRMDAPTKESIPKIISLFLPNYKIDSHLIIEVFNGLTGSDIKDICLSAVRKSVLDSKTEVTTNDLLISYFSSGFGNEQKMIKKDSYAICKRLRQHGLSVKEISGITGIPYTTLRDNVK